MELNYTIEGLDELVKKLEPNQLLGTGLNKFFNKAALETEARVKEKTPVDMGRLRADINHEIDSAAVPQWARIGTNTAYAPFVEYDTKPHFPPIDAITPWADRHGIDPFLVALAIAKKGTKGAHMFEQGLEAASSRFSEFASELGNDIEGAFK